LPER
jgi:hypothetical protein